MRLEIDSKVGDIEVLTWEEASIRVEIDSNSEKILDEATIQGGPAGEGFSVKVRVPMDRVGLNGVISRALIIGSIGADVTVRAWVPQGVDLVLKSLSANMSALGRYGPVTVDTTSGDVELGAVTSVRVKTLSGDITVESIHGDAVLGSASGDIVVSELSGGSFKGTTASGDVSLSRVDKGHIRAQSASGDVWIGVLAGRGVEFSAQSVTGEVSSEIDLGRDPGAGASAVVIRATSASGDVHLARCPDEVAFRTTA